MKTSAARCPGLATKKDTVRFYCFIHWGRGWMVERGKGKQECESGEEEEKMFIFYREMFTIPMRKPRKIKIYDRFCNSRSVILHGQRDVRAGGNSTSDKPLEGKSLQFTPYLRSAQVKDSKMCS